MEILLVLIKISNSNVIKRL